MEVKDRMKSIERIIIKMLKRSGLNNEEAIIIIDNIKSYLEIEKYK